jgi:hypothetical protein
LCCCLLFVVHFEFISFVVIVVVVVVAVVFIDLYRH